MTIEEVIAYFTKTNEGVVLAAKDANVYDYENQQIKAVCMRRTFEANKMAIASLEAWEKVKAEIDAYLVAEEFGTAYRQDIRAIINKHLQEVENADKEE